jgi:hypothetical protein
LDKDEHKKQTKELVESIFTFDLEQKKKQLEPKEAFNAPIDLASSVGSAYNRMIRYTVKSDFQADYLDMLADTMEYAPQAPRIYSIKILNIYLNAYDIISKLVLDYYGSEQAQQIHPIILEQVKLFAGLVSSTIWNPEQMEKSRQAASNANGSYLVKESLIQEFKTFTSAQFTIYFVIEDFMQSCMDTIVSSGFRTTMFNVAMFSHQLGLLSKQMAEVLYILYNEINKSD